MRQNQPLGKGGTGSEPGDMMTKTTGGDSQLWQLRQNTQGPGAAVSAPRVLLEKEDARPGSGKQSPKGMISTYHRIKLKKINLKKPEL